jgi:hypothetical protein
VATPSTLVPADPTATRRIIPATVSVTADERPRSRIVSPCRNPQPRLNQRYPASNLGSFQTMLATKILGVTSTVFIVCFLIFGFWTWYRQRQENRPK